MAAWQNPVENLVFCLWVLMEVLFESLSSTTTTGVQHNYVNIGISKQQLEYLHWKYFEVPLAIILVSKIERMINHISWTCLRVFNGYVISNECLMVNLFLAMFAGKKIFQRPCHYTAYKLKIQPYMRVPLYNRWTSEITLEHVVSCKKIESTLSLVWKNSTFLFFWGLQYWEGSTNQRQPLTI